MFDPSCRSLVSHSRPSCLKKPLSAALLLLVLAAGSRIGFGQMDMAAHCTGMTMKEIPSPEKLPVPLNMTGIGNGHIAITGTPEAQMWFDQGLNLLHDFWDYESARAFEQAVRVDPKCAMCSWGLYEALMFRSGTVTVYSQDALANAVRLKEHATPHERLYIEAASAADESASVSAHGGDKNEKEIAIWRQLAKDYPDDLQAKIFLAGAVRDGYEDNGEPKKGTKESIAILQEVLKRSTNDSAANHYWIHAMEPGNHPEDALTAAALLASTAPASGHMVHMPGHIFYRVGDYAHAEHWFAESTAVDEAYMRDQHVNVDDDWNYVHNLMYGIANLMEEGKLTQATTLSAKLTGARGQLTETLYLNSPRDGIARLDPQLPIALRTGDWAAVLKMLEGVKPDAKLENLVFLAGQLREFATGMLAAQAGDTAVAQAASTQLDVALWHMTQKAQDAPKKAKVETKDKLKSPLMVPVMPDAMADPLLKTLSIMSLELRAAILADEKKLPEAKALFAEAAQEEKALGYREPPTYIRPVGETEGLALLKAGDPAGAHEAYVAALAERPKSGFGYYGMARSSEAAGDAAKAKSEYALFTQAWKDGDAEAPEMAHAKQYLAGQAATSSTAGSR